MINSIDWGVGDSHPCGNLQIKHCRAADIGASTHGDIVLFQALSDAGRHWLWEYFPPGCDHRYISDALIVERFDVQGFISHIVASGLIAAWRQLNVDSRKTKPDCQVSGCCRRSVESFEYFDILSRGPRGRVHVCAEHFACDVEGFLVCAKCGRLVVEHERWGVEFNGEHCCLECSAKEYFSSSTNWVDPRQVNAVVFSPTDRGLALFEGGVLNIASCAHVLAVGQPLPKGVKLFDGAEFNSVHGSQISGENLLNVIHSLDEHFVPVIDAAYQLAVSIGIYVREEQASVREEAA